ncbi:MAG: PilZ domain-containing protein [Pseudomonadota bacterium]
MSHQSHISDYSRYFGLRQKVCMVIMSAERDSEIYESFSGVVVSSDMDSLELMVVYGGCGTHDDEVGKATYKLTTEALGSGIQVLADLTGITGGNILQFRMHGALEMFQRRSVPRVELSSRIFQRCGNFPLSSYKKEWKRIMAHMGSSGLPPGLVLQETIVSLSAGGIGLTVAASNRPTPLSMFFVAPDEGLPICALAETVWEDRQPEVLRCGFRFIQILKSDQERINRLVGESLQKNGGSHLDYKRDWVLVDKMVADVRKPG